MNWTITPELIADAAERPSDARNTGILLTADGWEDTTWDGEHVETSLIALTKDDVYAWTDDDVSIAEAAEALAESQDWRIRDEDGEYLAPRDGTDPQVVTGTWEGNVYPTEELPQGWAEVGSWESAWWFDRAAAMQLIGEQRGEFREHGTGSSLWRTPGGRYVMHTRTIRNGPHETWTELDDAQAAEWAYGASEDEINDGVEQPPVIVAARHARALVDALTPPKVEWFDGDMGQRFHRADRIQAEAGDIVRTAAAISDLLRLVVAPQIRAHRRAAAQAVELAHEGNQTAAAEWLGMGRSTFAKLLAG